MKIRAISDFLWSLFPFFHKNKKWLIPVIITSFVLALLLHIGTQNLFEKTTIYKAGLQKVKGSPEVIDALGPPVKKRHAIRGSITKHSDKSISAGFVFTIAGSKESATVKLTGSQKDTTCHIHSLIIHTQSGEVVKLVDHQSENETILPAHRINKTVDLSNSAINDTSY